MSTWQEIPDEDIDLDMSSKEVNLLISTDECGNNYSTLTFEQVLKIAVTLQNGV